MTDNIEAAKAELARRQNLKAAEAELQRRRQPQRDVVATTDDGGVVYRNESGQLGFTSPGYSTTDQDRIAQIMEGATPKEVVQQGFDQQTISQSPITSRAVKAVEGVPFVGSYVDEAAGAMFGENARQGVRAVSGAMNRENPGQSAALQLAGGITGSIPLAVAAAPSIAANAAKTIGGRALQGLAGGAVIGGTEGAIYGAGKEGDRLNNAVEGGILGLGVGGVLGAAAPYLQAGVKNVLTSLRGSPERVIAKQLAISPSAARVVKNALDAGDIDEAVTALNRAGKGAMLADAGQPAAQLLDAAAATGGTAGKIAREAVEGRVTRESARLNKVLDDAFGAPSGLKTMAKAVRDETAGARGSAYDAAYSQPINYAGDRGRLLEGLLRRVPKSAIKDANALMRANGEESAQIIAKVADDGTVVYETLPDVRQIDYITRALSGVADKADGKGKLGGQTPLGNAYNSLTRNIRNTLKAEVPEYGEALNVASDAISRVKAGDMGYSLLRPGTRREDIARVLGGASNAEKTAAKQGIRTYIDDTMANVARVVSDPNTDAREAMKALRDLSSRANRQKIEMVIGKRAAHSLFKEIEQTTVAFELRAALAQNSKTAIRQSIQSATREQAAPGMLESLASGEPVNAAKRFVQVFTGSSPEAQALREAGIYEEIARALTQTRGKRAKTALRFVEQAMKGQKLTEAQASAIGSVVSGSSLLVGNREASRQLSTR